MNGRSNGSVYVAVVVAVLVGYFSYQWWFNPNRAVKQRLGELAAALSVAADEPELDRLSRPSRVRDYFAADARLNLGSALPDIDSRERLVAALTAWTPPAGGWQVEFIDVQINVDSAASARAFMTVTITTRDIRTGQPVFENHEAKVGLANRAGTWVITSAEPNDPRAL